ncbi:bifunctional lysylphosphatidylglycerol synthetase/lysine--tRNA ligase LysX [Marinitenerispora sediminis]|uniref:bifunctional lysylphosphatidylglycerol synthetase/lysine--tRNA ligase LysX n=1 Tax=Marinitenerispora sediminis TaxID=1931232 RepID=UPI001F205B44|nr:bifunctional lysylphosphatidylglycerol synthetase/lysine--tRNA ligase LysX [Marinitenerispora sediminis]
MNATARATAPGRRTPRPTGDERPRTALWPRVSHRVPAVLAWALAVIALVSALRAVFYPLRVLTQPIARLLEIVFVPAPANLAYAVFLSLLAGALAARKRPAYTVALGYLLLVTAIDTVALVGIVVAPLHPAEEHLRDWALWWTVPNTVVTVLLLVLLVAARREFRAAVQPFSFGRALLVLVCGLAAGILLGWGLVSLAPGTLAPGWDRLLWSAEKVLGGAFRLTVGRAGEAPGGVNLALGLFGALALFAAVIALFRSQRARAEITPAEEAELRALLDRQGERDSLGYFATRRDKSACFSPSRKAAVTYRVVAGVSLASGDPIGDPEAWGGAVRAWLDEGAAHAWRPAVMGASEEGARAYARAGLRVLQLGDEAVLHVPAFSLEGRSMRVVRQAVHRVARAGYTVRVRRHAGIDPAEMAGIVEHAAAWRDTETERGFSMALGRLGDPADGACVLAEARDARGRLAAVLSFVPWGRHGLSLDVMRRDRACDNGLMEFMVVELVRAAPGLGVDRVSLNFAVFRSAFEEGARIGAGPVLRAWRGLLLFLSRWWQLEALYRSNVKYRPEWIPRFLCFGDARDLARVALASGIAEGFVTAPRLLRGAAADRRPLPSPAPPAVVPGPSAAERAGGPARPPGARAASEQTRVRLAKLDAVRADGRDPYPPGFPKTDGCAGARARAAGLPPGTVTAEPVAVAGRVVLVRDHGGICFATLRDWSGDLQVMLTETGAGAAALRRWRAEVDLGDHVGVCGTLAASRAGEPSVAATGWRLTAKCLRPLPDKRHGLTDPEARVRRRYLDLVVNPEAREALRVRGAVTLSLRRTLVGRGFVEVETPILQPVHGGAHARPFRTHINAYDMDLYLRIAPELFLKRLCVGGVERVFELGRAFRNEGASARHNPEFTMLEAYQAYADYHDMRALAQELVRRAATAAHGAPVLRRRLADGTVRDVGIGGDWPVVAVNDAVSAAVGREVTADTPEEELRALAGRAGVPVRSGGGRGAVLVDLYERLVEERTTLPTFYTDFPSDVCPLTRPHRDDPRIAEKWDLVAFGMEIGTAYSELVDPVEQRRRLAAQSLAAAAGDPEAMELDEDFLRALEYAMPPTGGLGLGVDRLVMLVTGRSIRDTLPFPLVRPGAR